MTSIRDKSGRNKPRRVPMPRRVPRSSLLLARAGQPANPPRRLPEKSHHLRRLPFFRRFILHNVARDSAGRHRQRAGQIHLPRTAARTVCRDRGSGRFRLAQACCGRTFSVFLLSLIGVPLTGGFFGKFYIFKAAIDSGLTSLTMIGLLTSAVAAYFLLASHRDDVHEGAGGIDARPAAVGRKHESNVVDLRARNARAGDLSGSAAELCRRLVHSEQIGTGSRASLTPRCLLSSSVTGPRSPEP